MPYLTATDLNDRIYGEIVDEITRSNPDIVDRVISKAIAEAKVYLWKYDLVQIFGDGTSTPTFNDDYLKGLVIDIAAWWLIKLANPNIDYESTRRCYEDAIKALVRIQNGDVNPNWPYIDTTGQTYPQGNTVAYSAFPKRCNNY